MIPCKQTKCLKLAVCKSKEEIVCTDLRTYYISLDGHDNDRWSELNDTLPHLKRLGITVMHDTWYPPVENPSVELVNCKEYYKSAYLHDKKEKVKPIKHKRMTLIKYREWRIE